MGCNKSRYSEVNRIDRGNSASRLHRLSYFVGPSTKAFSLPAPWRGLFERSRWIATTGALFAVIVLLLSSTIPAAPVSGNNHERLAASGSSVGNLSDTLPYIINASSYPTPDQIGASGANVSLPQLAVTSYDSSPVLAKLGLGSLPSVQIGPTYLYEMAYVEVNAAGITTLEFVSGGLNSTAAGNEMADPHCIVNCTHLPITWAGSTSIADFGTSRVTADAIGASGPAVVIAATSGGVTRAWASLYYGQDGTWVSMLLGGSVPGGTPRLAVQSSTAILTTISSGTLEVTNIHLPCIYTIREENMEMKILTGVGTAFSVFGALAGAALLTN